MISSILITGGSTSASANTGYTTIEEACAGLREDWPIEKHRFMSVALLEDYDGAQLLLVKELASVEPMTIDSFIERNEEIRLTLQSLRGGERD